MLTVGLCDALRLFGADAALDVVIMDVGLPDADGRERVPGPQVAGQHAIPGPLPADAPEVTTTCACATPSAPVER